ncbi:hypothetical protein HYC85_029203 [Camellia sinensis]|uniref:G-patch domain-containing protein n=1 Tax=Camellia sinensis TaxID=4442 RepID=A0A7J7FXE8_CAMSI|nr:hypothetical protein HYC85_029203 [Camellia sinensis]
MTRSGRYFKPSHLDQPEASRKNKEAERQREKLLEDKVVLKQLKKIQADISIWGLLMASKVHRQAVLTAMVKAKLSIDTTPDQLVGLVFPRGASPTLTITDKELPPKGSDHNKPLYASVECKEKWIPVVLVDTGSAINVCPSRTAYAIGNLQSTPWAVVAAPSEGCLFHLTPNVEVPPREGGAIVFQNSSIHPPPEVSTPVLENEHGAEDVFLSRFNLAEARVVQDMLAIDEGLYVSAQSVYLMNKLQHMPGIGLGRSGRKGVTALAEVPHNPYTFGLGYLPTKEDWARKGREITGRTKAKQAGKHYELVHSPMQGALKGRFVREGEDFPFYGFPKP